MQSLINIDPIAKVMLFLIFIIASIIIYFSRNYMAGDRKFGVFFLKIFTLIIFLSILVIADNMILFFISWSISNILLSSLMIHKSQWIQAKNSGILALKNFGLGAIFLAIGLTEIYSEIGVLNISLANENSLEISAFAMVFIVLAAITQSALIPFHKWLLSSLNSPTPVSALMHAGLVNGGGFLLIRFAPILLEHPRLLTAIFVIGLLSAIFATLWKLMKNEVKGMLACSTVAQMGFMVMQCGLGLFGAALAHLCWHGFFKAYLFLSFPSAVSDNRIDDDSSFRLSSLFLALIFAGLTAISFGYFSNKDLSYLNTNYVLVFVAFISGAQICLNVLRSGGYKYIFPAFILSILSGAIYGGAMNLINFLIRDLYISQPQELSFMHYFAIILMSFLWFVMIFRKKLRQKEYLKSIFSYFYIWNLNLSLPKKKTATLYKNSYKL